MCSVKCLVGGIGLEDGMSEWDRLAEIGTDWGSRKNESVTRSDRE